VEGGGGAVHWTVQNRELTKREVATAAAQGGGAEGGAAAPWMGEARPRISSPGEQSMPRREQRPTPWQPAAESRGKKWSREGRRGRGEPGGGGAMGRALRWRAAAFQGVEWREATLAQQEKTLPATPTG
jgi:hypothetical protein